MQTTFLLKPKFCPFKSFPIPIARSFATPKPKKLRGPDGKRDSCILKTCRRLLHLALSRFWQLNRKMPGYGHQERSLKSWVVLLRAFLVPSRSIHGDIPGIAAKGSTEKRLSPRPTIHRVEVPGHRGLVFEDAIQIMSAEYWIEHGQPDEALRELEKLSSKAMNHPWALRVHLAAMDAAREMNSQAHAE